MCDKEIKPGERIGIHFQIPNILDSPYGTATGLSGTIPLVMPYGEYILPSIMTDTEKFEKVLLEALGTYRELWPNDLDEDILLTLRGILGFVACCAPCYAIEDDISKPLVHFSVIEYVIDDIIDDIDFDVKEVITFKRLQEVMREYLFLQNWEQIEKGLDVVSIPAMDHLKVFSRKHKQVMGIFWSGEGTKNMFRDFRASTLTAYILKIKSNNPRNWSENMMRQLQALDIGILPAIEFISLMRGIVISEVIRENIFFENLKMTAASAVARTNGILGLRRDVRLDQVDGSPILIQMKNTNTRDLQSAFENIFRGLCEDIKEIGMLGSQLRECFPEEAALHEYIRIVEEFVDGHVHAYMHTARYGELKLKLIRLE